MKTTKRFWLTALAALVVGAVSYFVPSRIMAAQDPIVIIGGYQPPYWLLAANQCGGLFMFIAGGCAVTVMLALLLWLYHALSKPDGLRKTSLLSALLGVTCSFGLYCGLRFIGVVMAQAAFGGVVNEHPFVTAGSIVGVTLAMIVAAVLIWRIVAQKGSRTSGAFMADLLLFLFGGASTFLLWGWLQGTGSWFVHLMGW
ncbi:MAG: hypothetical protein E7553_03085 [Ruminococcaceae bacterium]|nr:hypothetical protein [Oscillospiraceae bacterium]